jgi:hypothetical protein
LLLGNRGKLKRQGMIHDSAIMGHALSDDSWGSAVAPIPVSELGRFQNWPRVKPGYDLHAGVSRPDQRGCYPAASTDARIDFEKNQRKPMLSKIVTKAVSPNTAAAAIPIPIRKDATHCSTVARETDFTHTPPSFSSHE